MTTHTDKDLLETARARYKLANEADSPQAQRERDDIAFEDGEQWPADLKLARMGQQPNAGMPAVPARPTIVINQVTEPIRQVLNQERAADLGLEIVAADDFGDLGVVPDDTEIELREGLVRRIQRESMAADARSWAFKRAVIAGRGYYLVMTRFLPGKTWDQEVYIDRIFNQEGVLLDPAHQAPDGSDAEWEFIGTWVPLDKYINQHGKLPDGTKNPLVNASDTEFISLTEQYPDWYRQAREADPKTGSPSQPAAIRVVYYWYASYTHRTLAILEDGSTVWEDELPKGVKPKDTRVDPQRTIDYCKIGGGTQILEQTTWAGPDMPIIKVLGDETLPYDHERRVRGMVRPARGSNMGTNYMVSKFVETVGLSPIPRDRIDPRAIDGYEDWWAVANTRTLPYLPYRRFGDNGEDFGPPIASQGDPNILPIAQGISMFREFTQQTTGGAAANRLGTNQRIQANAAIQSLQQEEQFNTSNFLDNLGRAVRYEAQVINNLLYPIYGARPDRLVRLISGEDEKQTWMIGDPQEAQGKAQVMARAKKVAKLTKDAHFNVAVKITKNSELRNDDEAQSLGEIIAADPAMMTWFGDLYFRARSIPNRKALAERARVMLHPQIQQMLAKKDQGERFDPASQAEIAQLQQRLQELEQIAGTMHQELQSKQSEQQAKMQIEQLKVQAELQKAQLDAERDLQLEQAKQATELERARMDNATKIHVAEIAAKTKGVLQAQEMEHEAIALAHTTQHEAEQADLDRENLERQAERQDAEAERSRQFEAGENERGRQADQRDNSAGGAA